MWCGRVNTRIKKPVYLVEWQDLLAKPLHLPCLFSSTPPTTLPNALTADGCKYMYRQTCGTLLMQSFTLIPSIQQTPVSTLSRLRAVPPFPSSDSTERGNRARKRPFSTRPTLPRSVLSLEGKGGTARSLTLSGPKIVTLILPTCHKEDLRMMLREFLV